jgi:Glycosyl hydrolase family 9.
MEKGNTALKKGIGKRIKSFIMAAAVAFSALGPVSSTAEARSVSGETIRFNDSRTITDYKYSDISYNYAKLLQYSLYLYDANMCGTNVGNRSLLSWRGNCHTYDKAKYTLKSGKTIDVDVTGGFHQAGEL